MFLRTVRIGAHPYYNTLKGLSISRNQRLRAGLYSKLTALAAFTHGLVYFKLRSCIFLANMEMLLL
jgi:hypothetical protein